MLSTGTSYLDNISICIICAVLGQLTLRGILLPVYRAYAEQLAFVGYDITSAVYTFKPSGVTQHILPTEATRTEVCTYTYNHYGQGISKNYSIVLAALRLLCTMRLMTTSVVTDQTASQYEHQQADLTYNRSWL